MPGSYNRLISQIKEAFAAAFPESDSDSGRLNILLPRLLYCVINLGGFIFALWKVNGMGLLPTHASDYVSAMKIPQAQQLAQGAFSLQ